MTDEKEIAYAVRRVLAEVDFYCGTRTAHRLRPDEVPSSDVRAAREALKQVIETELERVRHDRP